MSPRVEHIGDATLYLGDARDLLGGITADALVCDPPYGIGEARQQNGRISVPGKSRLGTTTPIVDWGRAEWDDETADDALALALRATRWAIVFGGNYYTLPPSPCWLVWDKLNSGEFADCELAWTNLPKAVRRLRYLWNGMIKAPGEVRGDHPTQKPIGVMKWAIGHLPDDVVTILDPFAGSGTTGVACVQLGKRFIGIEREPQYFDAMCRRISEAYRQPRLFEEPKAKPVQLAMEGL